MPQTTSIDISRFFTKKGVDAYGEFEWSNRDSRLTNPQTGEVVFEQKGLSFPSFWSQNAINIVAQKYFAGEKDSKQRESSLKHLVDRVVDTIAAHGKSEGYLKDAAQADVFAQELKYILASQRAAFNSPVWFNIGVPDRTQQASACFILGVEDSMPSILKWYTEEGMIFKGGSGAGTNLSKVRSSKEGLSGSSGLASGPVSFMRGADASAGTIRSGGKTRRAAKMVILNIDHPDISEFIWCKALEERKSRALDAAGFDMGLNGKDTFSIQYQNANNSVRVTDEFMQAVKDDADWQLKSIKGRKTIETVRAKDLFRDIALASWECADPGMQFDTTINKWHTAPNAGRINGSNPCSEYMHLDNSACNLASINLLKFLGDDGSFDSEAFSHTVELIFMAQEILVGYSSYPTDSIAKNAHRYRELGIGYANIGALLMAQGIAYDSEEGRAQAAAITALLTGTAYATSAKMSKTVGPFAGYLEDKDAMNKVLGMHRQAVGDIDAKLVREELLQAAASSWDEAVELCKKYGVRNSQASVLAPTGTIGLMMDCDTTGIEPDLGLVKFKNLVGGGMMTIVNRTVPRALKALGYSDSQIKAIVAYIDDNNTIHGAPSFKDEHLNVFACSMGDNVIHYSGHVNMMAAVQPFLSGAISKTVNMPEDATVEEVEKIHMQAWEKGLKAIAIYRDNCKFAQPLKSADKSSDDDKAKEVAEAPVVAKRDMPIVRASKTIEFKVADSKGFVTVGEYSDGSPGEIFVRVAKQGSTLAGLMDGFAISVSRGLQYGVPLKSYVKAFTRMSFAPSGVTSDPDIRMASSLLDYIFKKLGLMYLSDLEMLELGLRDVKTTSNNVEKSTVNTQKPTIKEAVKSSAQDGSAPMCFNCGNQTQRSGSCYVCISCGSTTGCS